jgi:hypothetical protein
MNGATTTCPVPREQQPLEEYQSLKLSWFFKWATLDLPAYMAKMIWIVVWSSFISGSVAAASFAPQKHPIPFLVLTLAGAVGLLMVVWLRLYLGWAYIRGRLECESVFYEESGWYDGQTWIKPQAILDRDRLIVTYELKPILQRLHRTFAILGLILLGCASLWYLG